MNPIRIYEARKIDKIQFSFIKINLLVANNNAVN